MAAFSAACGSPRFRTSLNHSLDRHRVQFMAFLDGVQNGVSRVIHRVQHDAWEILEKLHANVIGGRPVLIGAHGSQQTARAIEWLEQNGIDYLLFMVPEPFFTHVDVDVEATLSVDGMRFRDVIAMLAVPPDAMGEELIDAFKSTAPPVLLLTRGWSALFGFDEKQYRICFGRCEPSDIVIDAGLTARNPKHYDSLHSLGMCLGSIADDSHDIAAVLDYGCGAGGAVRVLKTRHPTLRVEGYDPNFKEWSKMPSGRFDTIMLHRVLNVIPSKDERDRVLDTVCSSFGAKRVLLSVPTAKWLEERVEENSGYYSQPFLDSHVSFYQADEDGTYKFVFQRAFTEEELDAEFARRGFVPDTDMMEQLREGDEEIGAHLFGDDVINRAYMRPIVAKNTGRGRL